VYSVAVNGDRIISGHFDNTVKIHNINTGELLGTLGTPNNTNPKVGHTGRVQSVASYGNIIVSRSFVDRTVIIWDLNSGVLLHTLNEKVETIAIEQDGDHRIISSNTDDTITIWDSNTGNGIHILSNIKTSSNLAIYKENGEDRIVICSDNHIIDIWDPNTGECPQGQGSQDDNNDENVLPIYDVDDDPTNFVDCVDIYKKGCKDKEDSIERVQECLGLPVTGNFDKKTEDAIFQKINKRDFTRSDISRICKKGSGGLAFRF
jgi:WD40 repeat protein